MITHNGNHVKLIDFGLSDTDDFAILKQPAGTPGYISPEQIVSQQADIRNDIFSIGCILEKILPSKPYTAIIKRCKAPITQRYANVDELKADFMARRNSHPSGIKRIVIAALACIILLGFISYPYCISRKRALAQLLSIPKPRRIQSSASKPRSLPHLPAVRIPYSQQLPSHLLHPIYKAPNSYPRERRLSTRCGRNPA